MIYLEEVYNNIKKEPLLKKEDERVNKLEKKSRISLSLR